MTTMPTPTDGLVRPFEATGRAWDAAAHGGATAVTTAALVAVAGLMAPRIMAPALAAAVLGIAGLTFASVSGSRLTAHGRPRSMLMALAAGCPAPFAVAVRDSGAPLVDALQGGPLLAWAVVWIGVGSARADVGAIRGARLGAGLAVIHLVAARVLPDVAAHAVAALAAVVASGLLPWRALAEAGVAGPLERTPAVDDDGVAPASLRDAFSALTWPVVAVAATITIAASALVREGGALPLTLALAVLLVIGLRAVTFVDRPQVIALWTAIVVPGLVLLLAGPLTERPVLVMIVAVVGVAVLVVAGGPRWADPGRRNVVRRVADLAERVTVPVVWVLVLAVVIEASSGRAA